MQRIYGKNDMKEKEYFELRDQPPMSTDRHPDLYRKAASAVHHQQSEPAKAVPTFTIPSSSNIGIEKEEIKSIKPYFPARQAYYQDSYPQQQQSQQPPPPQEVYTSPRNLHCIVIADHIVDCPICSRFYRNYTPIYNVIILILIIVLIVFIVRSNRGHHHHHPSASAPSIATKPVIATTSSFL